MTDEEIIFGLQREIVFCETRISELEREIAPYRGQLSVVKCLYEEKLAERNKEAEGE